MSGAVRRVLAPVDRARLDDAVAYFQTAGHPNATEDTVARAFINIGLDRLDAERGVVRD